jgi:hypothetical protein
MASGRDYRETYEPFRPGFNLTEERRRRSDKGSAETFGEEDVYRDASGCLVRMERPAPFRRKNAWVIHRLADGATSEGAGQCQVLSTNVTLYTSGWMSTISSIGRST